MKIYTVNLLAEELHVNARTLRAWAREGIITGFKIGEEWRFTGTDLARFVKRQRMITLVNQNLSDAVIIAAHKSVQHDYTNGDVPINEIVAILAEDLASKVPNVPDKVIFDRVLKYKEPPEEVMDQYIFDQSAVDASRSRLRHRKAEKNNGEAAL